MNDKKEQLDISLVLSILSLVAIFALGLYLYIKPEIKIHEPTFAVLDSEKMIEDISVGSLKDAKKPDEAKNVGVRAKKLISDWLDKDLPKYCPAPCIVFDKKGVVYGDVVDLNKSFRLDMIKRGVIQ